MQIKVFLNGTKVNPFHRLGLKCNPFPQIAQYEYREADRALAQLSAEPIPNVAHIRNVLSKAGAAEEFIELCCKKFKPGARVSFVVSWPDEGRGHGHLPECRLR